MYNREVKLAFGKNKVQIFYSFNENTKYADLFEYVSYLFPNFNLCPCFCFANNFNYINNDMKLVQSNDINEPLHFENINYDSKCHCSPKIKELLKMSKMQIIYLLLNNNSNTNNNQILENYKKKINDLTAIEQKQQIKIQELQNQLEICKKIKNLNENNINNQNEINKYERQIRKLEEEERNLINQLERHKETINDLNEKIKRNKKEIYSHENQIKHLKEEEKTLFNQLEQYNKTINELNAKIENYKNRVNNKNEQIEKLNNEKSTLERNLIGNNTIHIDKNNKIFENNLMDNSKDFKKKYFLDFYDLIIDIQSVKDINKGWKIKINERGLANYKEHKANKVIKIGVIGNSNKGKSFILSKISKINLPSGTSIRTEGLSVKYPELEGYKDRKIVLLDSAGLETPVLNVENIEKNKEKEMFREKSREKLITELFLQNYIINTGDILIVVVGILTYSEQKLLNRIRTEIQRSKLKKTLYVIHNLITYTSINQVQEYIEDYLLKSATFHLEKGHKVSTSEMQDSGDYYYEKNSDPHIFHLIYANEGSEAGNYYNNYTLKFIEKSYLNVTDLYNFDIIDSIKNRFIEISKEIIKIDNDYQLKIDDFCNNDNDNYKYIKLKDEKEITLKKCLIDELGFSILKASGFEPTYNFYKHKTDNKIIIRVEAPGNCQIKSKIEYRGENTIIQLSGRKIQDIEPEKLEDNLFNIREYGDFIVDIPLKTEDYKVLNEEPNQQYKKGLFIIEYKLDNKSKESQVFKPEELV